MKRRDLPRRLGRKPRVSSGRARAKRRRRAQIHSAGRSRRSRSALDDGLCRRETTASWCSTRLYGTDGSYQPSGQMVEGHATENDGKEWRLTLRDGLKWHDGEKVLARDCVASIRRWGSKDAFGQALLAATDELSAQDDKTIRLPPEGPLPFAPGGSRQIQHLYAGDDAGAARENRSLARKSPR